jgi:chemotaxis protein methyltransferase CheR
VTEPTLSTVDYERFRTLIQERSGLHFPERKRLDLASGVLRGLAESGYANLDEYFRVLRQSGTPAGRAAFEQLVNLLTIGETHFFRDQAQFTALEQHILPGLIAQRAGGPRRLRLWSAGCASGEEPYSLGMLLAGLLPDQAAWQITVLATDINSQALRRADEAVYGDWSFREERARTAQSRFFVRVPGPWVAPRYRLLDTIRHTVTFGPLNLVEDAYPALYNNTVAMDVILCRNVLIYFHEDVVRRVLERLSECLVTGGWLILGHADPAPVHGLGLPQLQVRQVGSALAYQKVEVSEAGAAAPWSSAPAAGAATAAHVPVVPPPESPLPAIAPAAHAEPPDLLAEVAALLEAGDALEAITRLEAHLQHAPDDAAAFTCLGEAYANLARWRHAREACERALALDALQLQAHFVLGMVREHSGDPDGALESFKRVLYLDRGHVLAHMAVAGLHARAGRADAARRALRNVVRLLAELPPGAAVPGAGGTTAGRLLAVAQELGGIVPQEHV